MNATESKPQLKPRRLSARSKIALATRIQKSLGLGRSCYDRADKLFERLRTGGVQVGEIIEAKDGTLFRFVDNYAAANVAFKTAMVKRFELKALNKGEASAYREARTRELQAASQPELQPA